MKVPFSLDRQHGVLKHLEHLIETKGFALICVAEGAGQVKSHWLFFHFFRMGYFLRYYCVSL
jgi:hypothetical protein